MFTFSASVMKAEFNRHHPDMLRDMENLDLSDPKAIQADYAALPNISIDYAIMEKTQKGVVLPSAFGWNDIGSWKSLYDFSSKDENNNVLIGDVIAKDTEACFIMGQHRLVVINHLLDTVVIDTPDAIFISNMENSREVKSIVTQIRKENRIEYQKHRTVYHPWGMFTLLEEDENHQISTWAIDPAAQIKLEADPAFVRHISITHGTATLECNNRIKTLKPGDATVISENQETLIHNVGQKPLILVQVQIRFDH